jgi:hypothetical protein
VNRTDQWDTLARCLAGAFLATVFLAAALSLAITAVVGGGTVWVLLHPHSQEEATAAVVLTGLMALETVVLAAAAWRSDAPVD